MVAPPIASVSDTMPSVDLSPHAATNADPPRLAFPSAPYQAMIKITPEDAAVYGHLKANPHDLPYPLNRRPRRPAATNPVDRTAPEGRRLFDGNFYDDIHNIKEGRLYMGPEIDPNHVYLGGKTMSELHEEMSNRHAMIMASYRVNLALHRNMKDKKKEERMKAGFVHAGFAVKKRMEQEREKARKRNLEAQQAGTQ